MHFAPRFPTLIKFEKSERERNKILIRYKNKPCSLKIDRNVQLDTFKILTTLRNVVRISLSLRLFHLKQRWQRDGIFPGSQKGFELKIPWDFNIPGLGFFFRGDFRWDIPAICHL